MADALDSGSSESNFMRVQVPSSAPKKHITQSSDVFFLYVELIHNLCYCIIIDTV